MKANELRIGNFVGFALDQLSIPSEVTVFTNHDCNVRFLYDPDIELLGNIQTDVEYKYIDYIPLTEEWLVKFGFKYQDRDISHGNGKIVRFWIKKWFSDGDDYWIELNLPTEKNRGFYWLNWDIGGGRDFVHFPHSCKLDYVHQLQNLYFALTGEELKIHDS